MSRTPTRFGRTALSTFAVGCFIEFGLRVYPILMRSFGSSLHANDSLASMEAWLLFAMLAGAGVRFAGIAIALRIALPSLSRRVLVLALLGEAIFCASILLELFSIIRTKTVDLDVLTVSLSHAGMASSLTGCFLFARELARVFDTVGIPVQMSRPLVSVTPVLLICVCIIQIVLTVPAVVASIAGMGDNDLGKAVKIGTVVVVGVGILVMNWGRLIWLFLLGKHLWKQSRLLDVNGPLLEE